MKEQQHDNRKKLFCFFLARLGNPQEAAVCAGYPVNEAAACAANLLDDKQVIKMFASYIKLEKEQQVQAMQGVRRLAFGSINDAVTLVMNDEIQNISGLDLFNISEIKRPKGGGCEIKFYDRLAALQILLAQSNTEQDKTSSIYSAIENSARALSQGEDVNAV